MVKVSDRLDGANMVTTIMREIDVMKGRPQSLHGDEKEDALSPMGKNTTYQRLQIHLKGKSLMEIATTGLPCSKWLPMERFSLAWQQRHSESTAAEVQVRVL